MAYVGVALGLLLGGGLIALLAWLVWPRKPGPKAVVAIPKEDLLTRVQGDPWSSDGMNLFQVLARHRGQLLLEVTPMGPARGRFPTREAMLTHFDEVHYPRFCQRLPQIVKNAGAEDETWKRGMGATFTIDGKTWKVRMPYVTHVWATPVADDLARATRTQPSP